MLPTPQAAFRKFWHAVMPLPALQGEAPQPSTLMGENIVLFLDKHGQPAALKDRGCHRTARLSKGRCVNGALHQRRAAMRSSRLDLKRRRPHSAFRILVQQAGGFYAETVIAATNPPQYHRVSGSTESLTQRHMRNVYCLPFSRRLDIEYPSVNGQAGRRHVIFNCFTPIKDGEMQWCQWLFRNDSEADCAAQLLIDFDPLITREDMDSLESTDPDARVDTRRRGVEFSMDSDQPGLLIRKQLMALLAAHGAAEVPG